MGRIIFGAVLHERYILVLISGVISLAASLHAVSVDKGNHLSQFPFQAGYAQLLPVVSVLAYSRVHLRWLLIPEIRTGAKETLSEKFCCLILTSFWQSKVERSPPRLSVGVCTKPSGRRATCGECSAECPPGWPHSVTLLVLYVGFRELNKCLGQLGNQQGSVSRCITPNYNADLPAGQDFACSLNQALLSHGNCWRTLYNCTELLPVPQRNVRVSLLSSQL